MSVVDIEQAKIQLSRLVDEAVNGGEVVIARANKEARPPRRLGTAVGQVHISEDFDEPLPDFEEHR